MKKKKMSDEEKVARIRQRTAMMEMATALMHMPWFEKLMNEAMTEKKVGKDAKPER